jgi:glutamate carboxypeptidase
MTPLPIETFSEQTAPILALVRRLVQIETPSTDKAAIDRLGVVLASELRDLGAAVTNDPQPVAGNNLVARWGSGPGGILVMCHMDTVWDLGTLERMPLVEREGRLYGPGVCDMKGGIALFLSVLRVLKVQGCWPRHPLTALLTSDEETGSLSSRPLIEDLARQAGIVLCLEPAMANGALKTARKGTGDITITVHGRAAHAGVDHEKGRNAIEELAHHILSVQKLTDYASGTTVNVGVIRGGTRSNVVPDEAHAEVDFRVTLSGEVARLESWAAGLQPVIPGACVSATVMVNRPPMPRDTVMAAAFQRAQSLAGELGMSLKEGSTGGGSDANFVAPLGVPVLDGLGVVGDGAHSEREHLVIASLPERAALLAALLTDW